MLVEIIGLIIIVFITILVWMTLKLIKNTKKEADKFEEASKRTTTWIKNLDIGPTSYIEAKNKLFNEFSNINEWTLERNRRFFIYLGYIECNVTKKSQTVKTFRNGYYI